MARKPTGSITVDTLDDGTRAFRLRFRAYGRRERDTLHERRDCTCGCGGGWNDRTVQVELENVLAKVQANIWRPGERQAAAAAVTTPRASQTFHEYASYWLAAKKAGTLGDPIGDASYDRLMWALKLHLLPFFGKDLLTLIDQARCLAFKQHKLTESDEIRAAIAKGATLRRRNGRVIKPLKPSSLWEIVRVLTEILDDAVEDGHIPSNPARCKRMRIKIPPGTRTFLEQDELALLLDAAKDLDQASEPRQLATAAGTTAQAVAALASEGLRANEIANRLAKSKATVSYHLRRLDAPVVEPYTGRQAVVGILGYSGPRVSEMCDLRIGQIRLHDPEGARFHIPDSKTPTGIRDVEITPDLAELLVLHLDRLRRAGLPTGPGAYLVPNTRGGRMSRQRAAEIVHEAAALASTRAQQRGMPPLPHVTPHTLRRTYVSIALLSSKMDIAFVMAQVGHADSTMTLDVYNQLQQRHKRDHGKQFDAYVKEARQRLPEPQTPEQALEAWTA